MSSDPSLLALVIDDPLAPKLLAAWKAEKLTLAQVEDEAALWALEDLTQAASTGDLKRTIKRCQCAGLLLEGEISEIADRWLSAYIGRALGFKSKAPAKPKAKS